MREEMNAPRDLPDLKRRKRKSLTFEDNGKNKKKKPRK